MGSSRAICYTLGGSIACGWAYAIRDRYGDTIAGICHSGGLPVVRHPSLSPDAASRDKVVTQDILARIAAALPAYLIDGVGFWLMLWLRLDATPRAARSGKD